LTRGREKGKQMVYIRERKAGVITTAEESKKEVPLAH